VERAYRPDESAYATALGLVRKGRPAALATVIRTVGSAPQVAGASAVFTPDGLAGGTVGGGFIEGEVTELARWALHTGRPRSAAFILSDKNFEEADGICGGEMTVLIDPRPERSAEALAALVAAARRRRGGVLAVFFAELRAGRTGPVVRSWLPGRAAAGANALAAFPGFAAAAREVLAENRPRLLSAGRRRLYLEPHRPRPRLVIAGAGHVGRAVAEMGRFLGFDLVVIDDRAEFANPGRFPGAARIIVGDPARILARLPLGREDHVVIVTRGHRHDEAALRAVIHRRPGYLGMIGSRGKVALMEDRFLRTGAATAAEWGRLHAPIGLPIGSRTVEEIAVSIAAELVRTRREGR